MAKKPTEKYAFEPFSSLNGVLRGEPFKILPEGTFYRDDRKLDITRERLEQMAQNVNAGLPRFRIPINPDHKQDAGKVGTVKKVAYLDKAPDGPGLYATEYELTDKGRKMVSEEGYDAPSAEVMWTLNGSKYQDPTTGKYHDNVLSGVALTPRPFFGHNNVSLYSATPPENFQMDEPSGLMHRVRTAAGLLKRVMTALDVAKTADPDEDGDDDTLGQVLNETATPNPEGENTAPVEPVPAVAPKGKPVDMTDEGVMKNQLPRELVADVQVAKYAESNLPPMMKCPKCGTQMPEGGKCLKCGYKDTGEQSTEKMSGAGKPDNYGDYDAETRRAMAEKGEALKDGSYPIANASDLQNAVHAVGRGGSSQALIQAHIVKRAKALGLTDRLPADWEGSSKGKDTMSDTTTEETFAVKPEEFAALKAKAEQFDALRQQVDTYAAELAKERKARRIEQFTATANDYLALPVDAKVTAEKFQALEEQAPELLKWVMEQFAAFDKALAEAGLFDQKTSARTGGKAESFAALVETVLRDKFNGAPEKYSEAMDQARQARPDLFAEYMADYSPNRGK